jgi:hypothetical protein
MANVTRQVAEARKGTMVTADKLTVFAEDKQAKGSFLR